MKKQSGWRGWSIFEDNPFSEGSFEWMDAPEIELTDEVRELTWKSLQNVDVDIGDRKLIWGDGKRLSIDESVRRIHGDYPELPRDTIEEHLIGWLEMVFAPESYSREQMDELDRLTEEWIDDHNGHQNRR